MPTYKLIYFNVKARAETSRILFALGGVEYEDKRVSSEEWAKLKSNSKFGQLPMLEVDGQTICQSHAIDRYLAKKFGYDGKDEWESAQIDMIVDCTEDVAQGLFTARSEQDDQKKAEKIKKFKEEKLPDYFKKFEGFLESNKGGDGFFVGDKISVADINFTVMTELMEAVMGGPLDWTQFPKLAALRERVNSQPKVADWIAKRPATDL